MPVIHVAATTTAINRLTIITMATVGLTIPNLMMDVEPESSFQIIQIGWRNSYLLINQSALLCPFFLVVQMPPVNLLPIVFSHYLVRMLYSQYLSVLDEWVVYLQNGANLTVTTFISSDRVVMQRVVMPTRQATQQLGGTPILWYISGMGKWRQTGSASGFRALQHWNTG